MNEIVIKSIEYLSQENLYIAKCIIVTGKVLPGTQWYLKHNSKLKIRVNHLVTTDNVECESYLADFTIDKPEFDLHIINKPNTWLNKCNKTSHNTWLIIQN